MSSEGIFATFTQAEVWQCTGEARWVKHKRNPDPYGPVVYGPPPVLQQRWVRLDAPGEEWRDVPTVEG